MNKTEEAAEELGHSFEAVTSSTHILADENGKKENPLNAPTEKFVPVINGMKESLTVDINELDKTSLAVQKIAPPKPPDGGWGWVVVFAAVCITTIIGGSYIGTAILYIEFVEAFQATRWAAGWIGSLSIGCGSMMGIFFGGSIRRFGSRVVCITGAFVTTTGYLLSAWSTSVVHLYLTYGIISGVGVSMMTVSSMVIVHQYFDKRRAIAAAIAVSGFSLGSLISGPVVQLLLDKYAWRGTVIIIGGIFLQAILFGSLFRPLSGARSRSSNKHQQATVSKDPKLQNASKSPCCNVWIVRFVCETFSSLGFPLLADPPFLLYILSIFCLQVGLTVFFQHTPSRAVHHGIERHMVALLPTIIGAFTGVSRLLFGFVANIRGVNRLLQYSVAALISGIIQATTGFATTFPTFALYAAIESTSNGGFYCIQSTITVDLKGIENVARSQAVLYFFIGVATLVSTPFAGYLFDVTQNYDIPFIVTGCVMILGGILGLGALWLRCLKRSEVVQLNS